MQHPNNRPKDASTKAPATLIDRITWFIFYRLRPVVALTFDFMLLLFAAETWSSPDLLYGWLCVLLLLAFVRQVLNCAHPLAPGLAHIGRFAFARDVVLVFVTLLFAKVSMKEGRWPTTHVNWVTWRAARAVGLKHEGLTLIALPIQWLAQQMLSPEGFAKCRDEYRVYESMTITFNSVSDGIRKAKCLFPGFLHADQKTWEGFIAAHCPAPVHRLASVTCSFYETFEARSHLFRSTGLALCVVLNKYGWSAALLAGMAVVAGAWRITLACVGINYSVVEWCFALANFLPVIWGVVREGIPARLGATLVLCSACIYARLMLLKCWTPGIQSQGDECWMAHVLDYACMVIAVYVRDSCKARIQLVMLAGTMSAHPFQMGRYLLVAEASMHLMFEVNEYCVDPGAAAEGCMLALEEKYGLKGMPLFVHIHRMHEEISHYMRVYVGLRARGLSQLDADFHATRIHYFIEDVENAAWKKGVEWEVYMAGKGRVRSTRFKAFLQRHDEHRKAEHPAGAQPHRFVDYLAAYEQCCLCSVVASGDMVDWCESVMGGNGCVRYSAERHEAYRKEVEGGGGIVEGVEGEEVAGNNNNNNNNPAAAPAPLVPPVLLLHAPPPQAAVVPIVVPDDPAPALPAPPHQAAVVPIVVPDDPAPARQPVVVPEDSDQQAGPRASSPHPQQQQQQQQAMPVSQPIVLQASADAQRREAQLAAAEKRKQAADEEAAAKQAQRQAEEAAKQAQKQAEEAAKAERRRLAEVQRKRDEEAEAQKRRDEEAEAQKRRDEEAEAQRKRDEEAEAQRKRDEEAEAQKRRDEEAAKAADAKKVPKSPKRNREWDFGSAQRLKRVRNPVDRYPAGPAARGGSA